MLPASVAFSPHALSPFRAVITPCLDHYIGFLHYLSDASFASSSMLPWVLESWEYEFTFVLFIWQLPWVVGTELRMLVAGKVSERFLNILCLLYLSANSQQCSVFAFCLWTSVYDRHRVVWTCISPSMLHGHWTSGHESQGKLKPKLFCFVFPEWGFTGFGADWGLRQHYPCLQFHGHISQNYK